MSNERIVSRVSIGLAILLGALTASVYLSRFPIPLHLLRAHATSAGAATGVLLAAWTCGGIALTAAGRVISAIARLEAGGRRVAVTDRLLIGVPVYGTVIAAIAWSGVSVRVSILVATLLLAVPAVLPALSGVRSMIEKGVPRVPVVLLVPISVAALGALMPVNSPDELIYKLSVPKAWLEFGRMIELPLNSNSYFPAAIYSADLGAIVAGGGGAARMVHFVLFLLALRVVWRLAEDVSCGSGLWSTVVFAWTPAFLVIAGWCWAEWGMLGLVLLSWYRFHRFLEGSEPDDLAIAALSLAGAVATKYTAGPWIAIFVPIAAVMLFRHRPRVAVRLLIACGGVVVVFGGFFYLRNLVWTGVPLAPFGLPDSPEVSNFRSEHGGWWELFHGFDIFYEGIIDDSLGMILPVAVLLSPLALVRFGRRQAAFFTLGLLQTIWLVTFSPTSRLILLGIAPLAVLGTAALHDSFSQKGSLVRAVFTGVVSILLVAQLMLVLFSVTTSYEPFSNLFGAETEREYLWRMRHFEKPFAWIEAATPPESVVLMLGETRAYHLDRSAHWAGNLDGPRVASWLAKAGDVNTLQRQFSDLGVTHVLVHREWYRVDDGSLPRASMLEKEFLLIVPQSTDDVLTEFLRDSAMMRYEDPVYRVYELR